MEQLKKYLLAEIDINLYDTICELERNRQEEAKKENNLSIEDETMTREQMVKNYIDDFLQYIDLNNKNFKKYIDEKNDFWNDQTEDGRYWCDASTEWADNKVEIYNYTLWQEAPILSEYIEEALNEFGFNEKRGIIGLLQSGQYMFYSQFSNEILDKIKKFVDNN